MCSNVDCDVTEFEVSTFTTSIKIQIYWEQSAFFSSNKNFSHNTLRAMITQINK